jgi:presenilin-like A22 family membrane protease
LPLRVIETRQLLQILVIFVIVQFFGVFLASTVFSGTTYQEVASAQIITTATSALLYIVYIIVFTAVIIFIFKVYKGDRFFILLEGAVIFISSFFVFLILSGLLTSAALFSIAGSAITSNFIIAIAAAVVLIVAKNKIPKLRNATAMIASIGVGIVLGISFSFLAAMIFMAILAVYDFIAVFITKHMITMAKAMSSRNLAFLVGVTEVEAIPKSSFTAKEIEEYKKDTVGMKMNQTLTGLYKNGMLPIPARVELGTGDLAVPLMVAVSAYKVYLNFVLSFFIVFGAILGLLLTFYILKRSKRILPAIPMLFFGVAAGLLSYLFLFSFLHL